MEGIIIVAISAKHNLSLSDFVLKSSGVLPLEKIIDELNLHLRISR